MLKPLCVELEHLSLPTHDSDDYYSSVSEPRPGLDQEVLPKASKKYGCSFWV